MRKCSIQIVLDYTERKETTYKIPNQYTADATYYFIMLVLDSTCFGHHYAHHQELTTIVLVIT